MKNKFNFFVCLLGLLVLTGQGCETGNVPTAPTVRVQDRNAVEKTVVPERTTAIPVLQAVEPEPVEIQEIVQPAPATVPKAIAPKLVAPEPVPAPTPIPTFVPIPAPVFTPTPITVPVKQTCCKICTKGKACGDSCISRNYTCHKGAGCACDGY